MPDRYKAGPLPDGLKSWAIYLAADVDLDWPFLHPLPDEEMAEDVAWALNRAAVERTAPQAEPPADRA